MIDHTKAFYSIKEFAQVLGVHHNTIRIAIKSGRISAFKVGPGVQSRYRIPASEFERMALIDLQVVIANLKNPPNLF